MSLTRTLRNIWLDDIARALARVGFVGNTFDLSKGRGALPPTTILNSLPLTSDGDLLYYAGGQLQRLPIGPADGMVLSIVSGLPAWVNSTIVITSGATLLDDAGTPNTLTDDAGKTLITN